MAANEFALSIVTPEQILHAGVATEVVLRTGEGDATFLADYAPLAGSVEPGVVRAVMADGTSESFVTDGGFVQVEYGVTQEDGTSGTRVTVLLGQAQPVSAIDAAAAQVELAEAEAALSAAGPVDEEAGPTVEQTQALAAVTWARARVDAAAGATTVHA